MPITKVHVIFSNHLDVGYVDMALAVVNKYFDVYFARAARLAAELRAAGGAERFRWMTQSWLVALYLDCPADLGLHCPNAQDKAAFAAAVKKGDIYWHAFPHDAWLSLMDPSLMPAMVVDSFRRTRSFPEAYPRILLA